MLRRCEGTVVQNVFERHGGGEVQVLGEGSRLAKDLMLRHDRYDVLRISDFDTFANVKTAEWLNRAKFYEQQAQHFVHTRQTAQSLKHVHGQAQITVS